MIEASVFLGQHPMYLHQLPSDLQTLAYGYALVRQRRAERADLARVEAKFDALCAAARPA